MGTQLKAYRVVLRTTTRNGFGLNGVTFLAGDGTAFECGICLISPPDNDSKFALGTEHRFALDPSDEVPMGAPGEIPRWLPMCPPAVVSELYKDAQVPPAAPDFCKLGQAMADEAPLTAPTPAPTPPAEVHVHTILVATPKGCGLGALHDILSNARDDSGGDITEWSTLGGIRTVTAQEAASMFESDRFGVPVSTATDGSVPRPPEAGSPSSGGPGCIFGEQHLTATGTSAVFMDRGVVYARKTLVFVRTEKDGPSTVGVLSMFVEETHGLVVSDATVLERLRRAVTAWTVNSEDGRRAWEASSEDLNIGDLDGHLNSPSLVSELARQGIRGLGLLCADPADGAIDYDTVLVNRQD